MKRGSDGKFHILYKVTNTLNERFYIGKHSTRILEDGYLGSGKRITAEVNKYGKQNFKREILEFCNSEEELFLLEKQIVNDDLIQQDLCLNLVNGGKGSFAACNSEEGIENRKWTFKMWSKSGTKAFTKKFYEDKEFRKKQINTLKNASKKGIKKALEKYPEGIWKGKSHSEETKERMGISHKGKHEGEKNSQYGKMWIYNLETSESIRIDKEEVIPEGWNKGRKIKKF